MKTKLLSILLTITILLVVVSLGSATANINNNACGYGYSDCIDDNTPSSSGKKSSYVPKTYVWGDSWLVDSKGNRISNETNKTNDTIINRTDWDLKNDTELEEYNNQTEVINDTSLEIIKQPSYYNKLIQWIIIIIISVVVLIVILFIYKSFIKPQELKSFDWNNM